MLIALFGIAAAAWFVVGRARSEQHSREKRDEDLFLMQAGRKVKKQLQTSFGRSSPCSYYAHTEQPITLKSATAVFTPFDTLSQVLRTGAGTPDCDHISDKAFDVAWQTGFYHVSWQLDFGQGRYWYVDLQKPGFSFSAEPKYMCSNRTALIIPGHRLPCDTFEKFAAMHQGTD